MDVRINAPSNGETFLPLEEVRGRVELKANKSGELDNPPCVHISLQGENSFSSWVREMEISPGTFYPQDWQTI